MAISTQEMERMYRMMKEKKMYYDDYGDWDRSGTGSKVAVEKKPEEPKPNLTLLLLEDA